MSGRLGRSVCLVVVLGVLLGACGGVEDDAPPGTATVPPTLPTVATPSTVAAPPTAASPGAVATATPAPTATMSAEELRRLRPNELGAIPILEYHSFTTKGSEAGPYDRTYKAFQRDLEWLYANGFYVVPLRDVVLNRIAAPAGKRPVVLTFDDSLASQFRLLPGEDGHHRIDPKTAVGVMEAFYRAHPDFGRGGFFAVMLVGCFDYTNPGPVVEEDQVPLCGKKIRWLVDHGYEVGNHTITHPNLSDVTDAQLREEVGGMQARVRALDARAEADILAMPFGAYPSDSGNDAQMALLRDGFTYEGQEVRIIACLKVGAEPQVSPASVAWDPIYIARIIAYDSDDYGYSRFWFARFAENPSSLYVSDGDPGTITVPSALPPAIDGTLDEGKVERDGLRLVRYDG